MFSSSGAYYNFSHFNNQMRINFKPIEFALTIKLKGHNKFIFKSEKLFKTV